jgi:cyclopropane fatty-acyl-phospholipid synthase-like methyltransferase
MLMMNNSERLAPQVARVPRPNRARSALVQVLNTVFDDSWVGQQRFTTTAEIDALYAALQVGPDAHVLDIGSGMGGPAIYLAQQTGCHVTGIDSGPVQRAQAAAEAAEVTNQVHFVAGDIFTARFPERAFDAIISRDAFVNVDDKERLFRQCWRLLRPGGRMACTMIVRQGEPLDRPECMSLLSWPLPTSDDYHALALQGGLRILDVNDLTTTFREVSARWRGCLAVWEEDLLAELGRHDFHVLQATIGQLAEWATQDRIGQLRMVMIRE